MSRALKLVLFFFASPKKKSTKRKKATRWDASPGKRVVFFGWMLDVRSKGLDSAVVNPGSSVMFIRILLKSIYSINAKTHI